MILRKWEVRPLDKERAAAFAQTYGVPFFLAMLMNIRGLDDAAHLREFLGEGEPLSDPFLLKDMDKAAARITRAVDNMEKIAVYGDYDADGVTSTAMLYSYLETRGADVIFYIPQREGEGYGMNMGAVEYLKEQGVSLIVTVDNGISSVQEVARANELGIDVVVTDHHRPQEILPDAVAVVDAYRPDDTSPYKHFSGVGIAFKLLMALEDGAGDVEDLLEAYSDLAAIGTIGDIVPLTGENRTLIRAGLERLSQSDRPGVQALLENAGIAGKVLTSTNVAFTLVPRINATGRMGAPERAVRLLISGYEEEAEVLSEEICADNEERRRVEAEIAEAAFADIEAKGYMKDRVVVVDGENWHHGVIGIVASRVTERCGTPCMIISRGETEAQGSGRSIEGFSHGSGYHVEARKHRSVPQAHQSVCGGALPADAYADGHTGLQAEPGGAFGFHGAKPDAVRAVWKRQPAAGVRFIQHGAFQCHTGRRRGASAPDLRKERRGHHGDAFQYKARGAAVPHRR